MSATIRDLQRDSLKRKFRAGQPFPFIAIDNFLDEGFAADVAASYPSYEDARRMGREFHAVNEKLKVQITDHQRFPPPVKRLSDALASRPFLEDLEYITGITNLQADPALAGGGMHLSGRRGRLDVHVDFNYLPERGLHRRLNILVYLNRYWQAEWGGAVELWNADVSQCVQRFEPVFNRCVIFETSEISFHGVTQVKCPRGQLRKSFAAYYYTREAPDAWDGTKHSTIFRARPHEHLRASLLMPASTLRQQARELARSAKRKLRAWIA